MAVSPQRLVMISFENNCMFCENPKGACYSYYVSLTEKMGYIACVNCKEQGERAVQYWHDNLAYGAVHYLKDSLICVKRTSGVIETDWSLDNPWISQDANGNDIVHCYQIDKDVGRWCQVKEIMELNPPKNAANEEFKNLCSVCDVDMGPDNPRQLCRKTYCENARD